MAIELIGCGAWRRVGRPCNFLRPGGYRSRPPPQSIGLFRRYQRNRLPPCEVRTFSMAKSSEQDTLVDCCHSSPGHLATGWLWPHRPESCPVARGSPLRGPPGRIEVAGHSERPGGVNRRPHYLFVLSPLAPSLIAGPTSGCSSDPRPRPVFVDPRLRPWPTLESRLFFTEIS